MMIGEVTLKAFVQELSETEVQLLIEAIREFSPHIISVDILTANEFKRMEKELNKINGKVNE